MKKNKMIFVIIGIAIVIVIILVIFLLIVPTQCKIQESITTETETPVTKEIQQETVKETETEVITAKETTTTEATSKETQDDFNKWSTYVNDIYGYEFKYPAGAEIIEAQKSGFGVLCITINYKLGYITISVPENEYFECGRTGVGNEYEMKDIEEELTIEGKKYIAKGNELFWER